MTQRQQNFWVGVLGFLALVGIGWMLVVFRDLPVRVNRHGANIITVYFPKAPGVEANTIVKFLGYSVGRVVAIDPPAPIAVETLDAPPAYRIRTEIAIDPEYRIPAGIIPKVMQKGLGSSHLELILPEGTPAEPLLAHGDIMLGEVSTGTDFIPETTQARLDELIVSLTQLGSALTTQFISTTPEQVDGATASDPVYPNLTTAIMRLDRALKHFNEIAGDTGNQQYLAQSLEGLADLTQELRAVANEASAFLQDAQKLARRGNDAIDTVEGSVITLRDTYDALGIELRAAAQKLSGSLKELDGLMAQVTDPDGTAGRILTDPRLYESLTDAAQTLNISLKEFRDLMAELNEHGVLGFKGNKKK